MGKIWAYFRGILAAIFLASVLSGGWLWLSWRPVGRASSPRNVVISPGMSLAAISQQLKKDKLIRSPLSFQLLVYLLHYQNRLQAGKFVLNPKMTAAEIARNLTQGKLDAWLQVKEGWRREQIANLLAKNLHRDGRRFLTLTKNDEGRLFPDSYLLPPYFNEAQIASLLEKTFIKKTASLWPVAAKQGLKTRQVLILASLVEREAKFSDDRTQVAAVFLNRWRAGWPLQVDATVQYAKANAICRGRLECDWWPKVGRQDMGLKSPYNTYLRPGLPPAPICNPSLAAIKAVIEAPKTSNWYYVSDNQGRLHFAQTLAEHNRNIQRYLH